MRYKRAVWLLQLGGNLAVCSRLGGFLFQILSEEGQAPLKDWEDLVIVITVSSLDDVWCGDQCAHSG